MNIIRKTHPMVLVAAVALTIFSLLGSAAITGLIPTAHSEKAVDQVAIDQPSKPADSKSGKPANGKTDSAAKASVCKDCGHIVSIRTVNHEGEGSGLGAVAGGVTGGVVGNQIGKGKGNTLMTLIGIGGGAYAGHTIEKNMKSTTSYSIKVQMQDGSYRTVTQYSQPQFAVGDEVRVQSGQLIMA